MQARLLAGRMFDPIGSGESGSRIPGNAQVVRGLRSERNRSACGGGSPCYWDVSTALHSHKLPKDTSKTQPAHDSQATLERAQCKFQATYIVLCKRCDPLENENGNENENETETDKLHEMATQLSALVVEGRVRGETLSAVLLQRLGQLLQCSPMGRLPLPEVPTVGRFGT